MILECVGGFLVFGDQDYVYHCMGGDSHLTPDIAYTGDHPHDALHFLRCFVIDQLRPHLRIVGLHDALTCMGELLPDLLGDKGHVGVEELEGFIQDVHQGLLGYSPSDFIGMIEIELDQLQVPVTQLVPDKVVDELSPLVKSVFLQGPCGLGDGPVEPSQDPFIRGTALCQVYPLTVVAIIFQVHCGEPCRVPDLVGEVAISLDPLLGEPDIPTLRGEGSKAETKGIGAILFDHHQGIDDVPLGLAHLLSLHISHQGMNVDIAKGDIPHKLESHHHHPRHPEEEDVKTRN